MRIFTALAGIFVVAIDVVRDWHREKHVLCRLRVHATPEPVVTMGGEQLHRCPRCGQGLVP